MTVYAVNYPLAYFAGRLGGEQVQALLPAPADVDPAFWQPDPDTIVAYQRADLILLNGAGYARWVNTATLPLRTVVNTSAAFADRYIPLESSTTHSHGPRGAHSTGDTAFTTWLDLDLAARQAGEVAGAMTRVRPALGPIIDGNLARLRQELVDLDQRIAKLVGQDRARPMIGSHPVYQYLARRYAMNVRSVHWEPRELPSKAQWTELENLLEEHPAEWMIWEADPLTDTAARLESLGVRSLVFDPGANVPESGDFLSTMRENARSLARAYD